MKRLLSAGAVLVGAVSFGILSTFVKKAYSQGFTLGEVTGIQAAMGMIFLWALVGLTQLFSKKSFRKYPQISPKWRILVSGLATGSVSILYYKCIELVPASLAIVLLMQYLWIGLLIERIVYRSRPTSKQLIGAIAILISTIFATGIFESSWQNIDILGVGYGLLAATAYSLFLMVNGRIGNDHPPLIKSAIMITGAFLWIILIMQPWTLLQSDVLMALLPYGLLLSLFGTVLPPLLFAYGIPKIGLPLASILSASELPVAVSMSYFVLQEEVKSLQWLGVFFILIIIVWTNTSQQRKVDKVN